MLWEYSWKQQLLHKIKINGEVPKSAIGPYDLKDIFRKDSTKWRMLKGSNETLQQAYNNWRDHLIVISKSHP